MSITNLKTLVQKLNPVCQRALETAAGICLSHSHYNVELEHWFLSLLEATDNDLFFICKYYGVEVEQLSRDLSASLTRLKTGNAQAPALSQRIIDLIREALLLTTLEFTNEQIRSAYLLYAFLQEESFKRIAHSVSSQFAKISVESLYSVITNLIGNSNENAVLKRNISHQVIQTVSTKTPALDQFTINLTKLAQQGKIDQVIGREVEIRQLIDILSRRRQNNPILTGEPGVGKTAIVEGFALRIVAGEVPPVLKNVAIHALDLALLQAGVGIKGEFENRLQAVIQEIKASAYPIILFVDEAHMLVGAGAQAGQGDAANLLKPVLARGELRTIAATTWGEYKKYFEQDAALARRFQVIKIDEPTEAVAIMMLRGLVNNLEAYHQVRILDEAIIAAVRLSDRYLSNRQLPDKAISVLDTACARLAIRANVEPVPIENYQSQLIQLESEIAILQREIASGINHIARLKLLQKEYKICQQHLSRLQLRWQHEAALINEIRAMRAELEQIQIEAQQNKSIAKQFQALQKILQKNNKNLQKVQAETPLLQDCVNAQLIAEVIAGWTGIPLGRMHSNDVQQVLQLEQRLQQRILGQPHALKTIAQSIYTSRAYLTDPQKPIGVFLLVGPSGVGKTETAHALAELLYGSQQNMTIINLSEFKEEHKVSLLLGSPPGYVGYGEGGILTEAVRRKPYSLVLLDEVEKAHTGVQDIFYQVFDKGMLRDGQGRDVNFKNAIIILTSNTGSELITKLCADPELVPTIDGLVAAMRPELLKVFKPAFLGRVTVVPYLTLNNDLMRQIIKLQLDRIQQRIISHYQADLSYDEKVIKQILASCQLIETGARNIEHIIKQNLLPVLSAQFLTAMAENRKIKNVIIDIDNNEFTCQFK